MKVMPPTFEAIMCAATDSAPSRPISSVITENRLISMKLVTPMGRPSFTSRTISLRSGQLKRLNTPVTRILERLTTSAMASQDTRIRPNRIHSRRQRSEIIG